MPILVTIRRVGLAFVAVVLVLVAAGVTFADEL